MNNRINRLIKLIAEMDLDAVMISGKANIFYFSGFESEDATLIVTKNRKFIITDFRYYTQARLQAKDYELVDIKDGITNVLSDMCIKKVGIEDNVLTLSQYNLLVQKNNGVDFVCMADEINNLRMVKDGLEIELIKKAAQIADAAFSHILNYIKTGMSERDVAAELERFMINSGAQGRSFDIIVASGVRSAMPHGTASDKIIQNGELVTIDFGCVFKGYCSDMTRTIAMGYVTDEQKKVYDTVKAAQLRALEQLKSGQYCNSIDAIARDYIDKSGYGKCFGHGLGHGVGVEIHECPNLSPKCSTQLQPDMIVTVEPGIYLDGKFGVRIEDLVCVKDDGIDNFTVSEKELLII